jgi:carbamoyltransferase
VTAILGLSAYYHDSAAALVVDGNIVAAAQEERFSRKKHDAGFPAHAVDYCLAQAGLTLDAIDYVTFYDKPLLKFDRLIETYLAFAPSGFASFRKAMPVWVKEKLFLDRELRRGLPGKYSGAFSTGASPVACGERVLSLAVRGRRRPDARRRRRMGDGHLRRTAGQRITLTHELRFPHSLGLLYSAFTYYCGFGELGRIQADGAGAVRRAAIRRSHRRQDGGRERRRVRVDGHVVLQLLPGLTMTSPKFDAAFGGPPRQPESPITQREMDIARVDPEVTEDAMLKAARHVHAQTGIAQPVPRRRRGAQLRRQRPHPARRAVREHLDPAGRGRRGRRARRRALRLVSTARSAANATPAAATRCTARGWGRRSRIRKSAPHSTRPARSTRCCRTTTRCASAWRG